MEGLRTPFPAAAWCALSAFTLFGSSALAQGGHGHSAFCDPATVTPEPVLDAGDFDGDGTVTQEDVRRIEQQVQSGAYIAFFDRNADRTLDQQDIDITEAEVGTASGKLDQQLAVAFENTEEYRNKQVAIEDGFIPLTERFYGHGAHWIEHPKKGTMDYTFEPGNPEGLNYHEDRLWGVFYYIGESGTRADGTKYPPGDEFRPLTEAPEGFAGDEDVWHFHAGACIKGLNYEDPAMDPSKLTFREGLSPKECLPVTEDGEFDIRNAKWTPKAYMIHAWLYDLNPCGTFAGAHPLLAEGALHPDEGRPHGKIDTLDPHPEYQFAGGTLCHWLDQVGRKPGFCEQRQAQQ